MSAIEDMLLKFTSGNDVAVQRAVVTLDEWRATYAEYMALQARVAELEKREAAYDIILKVVSNALERAGVTECDNPGDAIEMITKERDGLLSQLPEGMKHCTIIFKECDKGHGWLTATNWVQHGCPKCEFDRIVDEKHELQRLRRQSSNMVSALHLEACQWRLKAEKAEQERDGLAAKCAELEKQAQAVEDSETLAGAALMLVHDRFMRGVLTKEIMSEAVNSVGTRSVARIKAEAVREAVEWLNFNYQHLSSPVCGLLTYYANQIEGEGGV